MVEQSEKIQNLETLLASVQFGQQENGTASVGGSIPGRVPASTTIIGDTTLTRESMEPIFKT